MMGRRCRGARHALRKGARRYPELVEACMAPARLAPPIIPPFQLPGARLKLLFGLIGAALGLATGDWTGALAGAAFGVIVALVWDSHRARVDGARGDHADASPALAELVRRVQSLEKEL